MQAAAAAAASAAAVAGPMRWLSTSGDMAGSAWPWGLVVDFLSSEKLRFGKAVDETDSEDGDDDGEMQALLLLSMLLVLVLMLTFWVSLACVW